MEIRAVVEEPKGTGVLPDKIRKAIPESQARCFRQNEGQEKATALA